jgi:ubiquinone/menaquinone biosynthesis C-methylase UbiE
MSGSASPRAGNYAKQAETYDLTRGASPTVVRSLAKHLGPAGGRTLLDIAGGTGNYAMALSARGFRTFVVDASPEMLAHAAGKLGPGRCVAGDAERLPVRDAATDGAIMVNCLHLIADPPAALAEVRRIIRAGPLLLTAFTRENLAGLFVYEYFGLEAPPTRRPPTAQFEAWLREAGFGRIEGNTYIYTDTVDGSLNALHTNAMHLAGPAYLRNTSFWYALDEETRRRGLAALARDLRSGTLERRVQQSFREAVEHGHGTLFVAWP